jgi:hypothetical protein
MELEELPDEILCYIFHSKVSEFFSSSSSSSSLLATDPHVLILVSKRWNRIFTQSFVFEEQHFNRFVLKPCGLTPSSRIEPERIPLVTTTCRRLFLALGRLSKVGSLVPSSSLSSCLSPCPYLFSFIFSSLHLPSFSHISSVL